MTLFRVCLTSLLLLAVACGDSSSPEAPDAGQTRPDAGVETPDSGDPVPDAGTETPDAGTETPDSGTETPDSGSETPDSGTEPTDAGSEPTDAGSGTPDGGGTTDANVIDNGGFEEWSGATPALWFGSTTNIEEVKKVTTQAFEGVNAAQLINTSSTHRRFSTAAKSMPAGRYACTYRARGTGDVRNGWFGTDYSSYSGYTSVDTRTWTQVNYNFNLANSVFDTFELIFSVRNTSGDHLLIDDVRCVRAPEPCDSVTCEDWARCDNATVTCQPLSGRCEDAMDCSEWQACDATHTCVTAADRCVRHADCAGTPETPVCDTASHFCIEGDPCAGVTCNNPATSCNPTTGVCELAEGACFTTYDCRGALPACDPATRRCVAADHAANIIRNGGFENWSTRAIPYYGNNYVPDYWYGLDNGITDPGSEIKPSRLARYTSAVHGGSAALQFVVPIQVAERFTTEKFNVPVGNYSCSYRVRGHGSIRHRSYSSGGWSPQTDFITVDSDEWQPVFFRFTGNVRDWRLFFYPSRSVADRDHLQVDDVVCTKD
ncbi:MULTISPECIES: invertase recombinase-like protein [unclassified Corallococcus]|uniref:invertase recombinase-like protein n=1 Tax=unclassified Corallococcus TaxID=2685029 RepID=UPI001A8F4826|nr:MULTISPECIES: invertase recombinase-like protein [unclassified Corallococcus]MBN9686442.1 invertase recombinase-like protein [Corallococcus sp. NCSPR001]WAS82130.1 invertase recombinase-like protein [Corallococcus sp. NCRR]